MLHCNNKQFQLVHLSIIEHLNTLMSSISLFVMQGIVVDELPEVMTLDERGGDATLSRPSETNTVSSADNEVVVLEESAVVSPAVVFNNDGPEAGSKFGFLTKACTEIHALFPLFFF